MVLFTVADASLRPWVSSVPDADGVWERLNKMPGLDGVKRHLQVLQARLEAEARLREAGLANAEAGSHHLVFTGKPGTGPGQLNIPDGFDLLLPDGSTPTHPATG